MLSLRDEYNRTREWVYIVGLIGIVLIILDLFGVIICLAYYGIMGEWFVGSDQIVSVVSAVFITGFVCITFTSFVEN